VKGGVSLLFVGFLLIAPMIFPLVMGGGEAFWYLWEDLPSEFISETGIAARWPVYLLLAFVHLLPVTGLACVGVGGYRLVRGRN